MNNFTRYIVELNHEFLVDVPDDCQDPMTEVQKEVNLEVRSLLDKGNVGYRIRTYRKVRVVG